MGRTFRVDVVTPEAVIWSGEAEMLTARTIEGDIGILADHEPTMAALATGAVVIHHEDGVTSAGIHGGFLQIFRNEVTILTDWARLTDGGLEEADRPPQPSETKTTAPPRSEATRLELVRVLPPRSCGATRRIDWLRRVPRSPFPSQRRPSRWRTYRSPFPGSIRNTT